MSILNSSSTKAGIPARMEGVAVNREAAKRNRWRLTILFAAMALGAGSRATAGAGQG